MLLVCEGFKMIMTDKILDTIKAKDYTIAEQGKQLQLMQEELHSLFYRNADVYKSNTNIIEAVKRINDRLEAFDFRLKKLEHDKGLDDEEKRIAEGAYIEPLI